MNIWAKYKNSMIKHRLLYSIAMMLGKQENKLLENEKKDQAQMSHFVQFLKF